MDDKTFDDDVLMAYADGELDAAAARRVEGALAADAALAARVEAFRRSARLAREAYAADLDRPLPEALRAAVQAAVDRAAASSAPPALGRQTGWWRRAANQPLFALAASFAMLAAGALGYLAGGLRDAGPGFGAGLAATPAQQTALRAALGELPSGEGRALDATAKIEMLASFRSGGGALCREFRLLRGPAAETTAIACHGGDDGWTIAFAATAAAAGSGYLPAGAHAAVDAYLSSIGAGPALDAADERSALSALR